MIENLVGRNLERAQALRAYQGTRYLPCGIPRFSRGPRRGDDRRRIKYRAPGTKEFTIRSATGSRLIIDKVFKKLLEAEQEALAAEAQRRAALNSDNYDFTMLRYESTPSGSVYVLKAEPRTKDKFLYRGRVWVDGEDFAVVRLVAEPAKNPSFWTKNSELEQLYVKVSDFWLPARNHKRFFLDPAGRACRVDDSVHQLPDHGSGSGRQLIGAETGSVGGP